MTVQAPYATQATPSMPSAKIMSATDFHAFNPTSGSWSGGTITLIYANHNLASSDVVSLVSSDGASLWNVTDVVATVVDKDTFTVPLVGNPGTFPVPGGQFENERVSVICKSYSRLTCRPAILQVDALPSGTNVQVQIKLHADASWTTFATITPADGSSLVNFSPPVNYVRVARSAGTGQPVVYAQN